MQSEWLDRAGVSVWVKREDLNHPLVSGNKWWKLKYNLSEAQRLGCEKLVTFGGAYSNHLYATAAAAHALGMKSLGIVRGEKPAHPGPTLQFVSSMGMELIFVSREEYRHKEEPGWMDRMHIHPGLHYLIPEGGTNRLAIEGVMEWGRDLNAQAFDYWCVPVGTGGTLAGLVATSVKACVIGFSSLKNGGFLTARVEELLQESGQRASVHWLVETSYHFGGYARTTEALNAFLKDQQSQGLPLDPVYTGKMFYGVLDMIRTGVIPHGSRVCVLHTGGLQGASSK